MALRPRIIGYRRDGHPIWLVQGGDGTGDPPDPPATGTTGEPDPAVENDKDWQAEADKWKSLARKHEKTAKDNAEAAKRLTALEEATKTETERAVEAARREADKAVRDEVGERYRRRIVSAEVRAAAGGRLADPADAVRLLDLDQFALGDDDELDGKAIRSAIDQLLEDKPYLAASGVGRRAADFDGGGRGGNQKLSGREAGLAEAQRRFGTKTQTQ